MAISVIADTKKRQNTNVKGSMVSSPILIIGKDVPHKAPANIVKNTALDFWLSNG